MSDSSTVFYVHLLLKTTPLPSSIQVLVFFTRKFKSCIITYGLLLLLLSHFSRVRLCATP